MRKYRLASLASALLLLSCQDPEYSLLGGARANLAGVHQIIDAHEEQFDDARLASLIARFARAPNPGSMDGALAAFDSDLERNHIRAWQEDRRLGRNEIQGILLTASIQRCNFYKQYLRRISSHEEFAMGSLATIFGGVGAIVTGVQATRIFSALAGISSGIRAEFMQDFLSNLSTSVIIPGIEKRRGEILIEIANKRCLGVPSYSLTMAIADAVRFHGACSADVGIAEAGQAVGRSNEVGLDAVKAALQKARDISDLAKKIDSKQTTAADDEQTTKPPLLGEAIPLTDCPPLNDYGNQASAPRKVKPR
jgi:hypothetical protein